MADVVTWIRESKCPVCGNTFSMRSGGEWAYKMYVSKKGKGTVLYFCSYKCKRAKEKEREEQKWMINEERKERLKVYQQDRKTNSDRRKVLSGLIEAFRKNGTTPEEYLEKQGYKNPKHCWSNMRGFAKTKAPDLYQKCVEAGLIGGVSPLELKRVEEKAAEVTVEVEDRLPEEAGQGDKEEGADGDPGERQEKEEKKPAYTPVNFAGFDITAVRSASLGEFYYDRKFGCVDWRTEGGDEVSLSPWEWLALAEEMPRILSVLGANAG